MTSSSWATGTLYLVLIRIDDVIQTYGKYYNLSPAIIILHKKLWYYVVWRFFSEETRTQSCRVSRSEWYKCLTLCIGGWFRIIADLLNQFLITLSRGELLVSSFCYSNPPQCLSFRGGLFDPGHSLSGQQDNSLSWVSLHSRGSSYNVILHKRFSLQTDHVLPSVSVQHPSVEKFSLPQ